MYIIKGKIQVLASKCQQNPIHYKPESILWCFGVLHKNGNLPLKMKCDSEISDAKEGSRNSSGDFKGITMIGNVEKKFI